MWLFGAQLAAEFGGTTRLSWVSVDGLWLFICALEQPCPLEEKMCAPRELSPTRTRTWGPSPCDTPRPTPLILCWVVAEGGAGVGLQLHTGPLCSAAAASWPSPTTSEPVFSAAQREGVQCGGGCEVLLRKCLPQGPVSGCRAAVRREGRAVGAGPHGLLTWWEGHPWLYGSPVQFQVSKPQSRPMENWPVSSPGGWHLSCAFPTKHPTERSVASRAEKPPDFANSGCRGPGSRSPHRELPGLGGSGNTGLRMLLVQHWALRNHFEDERPLGWAAGRGPGPALPGWPSEDAASGRPRPGPVGGGPAEWAAQGQSF